MKKSILLRQYGIRWKSPADLVSSSLVRSAEQEQTLHISLRKFKARADQLLPYSYTRTNGGTTWAFWTQGSTDLGIFATLSDHHIQNVTYQFRPDDPGPTNYPRILPVISSLFRLLLPTLRPSEAEIRAALDKARSDDKPVEWSDGRVKIYFRFKHGRDTRGEGEYDWMRVEIGPPNYIVSDDT